MAVLCDRIVFSLSSNSWKISGFRAVLGSATVFGHQLICSARWVGFSRRPQWRTCVCRLTSPEELYSAQCDGQSDGIGQPFPLHDEGAEDKQAGGDIDPIDVLLRGQRFLGRHRVQLVCLAGSRVGNAWRFVRDSQRGQAREEDSSDRVLSSR